MNRIGLLIEGRRRQLGMSRDDVATRLGVTAQTVLNLERDPDYNIGTRLLGRLEGVLKIEFITTLREVHTVDDRIRIGNDELILHIRKNGACKLTNDQLAKRIWIWLRDNAAGVKVEEDRPSMWGADGEYVSAVGLPKTAAQIEFRLDALPDLFRFIAMLGKAPPTAAGDDE